MVISEAREAVRSVQPRRQPWETPVTPTPHMINPRRAGAAELDIRCSQLGRADDFWDGVACASPFVSP